MQLNQIKEEFNKDNENRKEGKEKKNGRRKNKKDGYMQH